MSRSEDIAAIRHWLDQTDDGGYMAWHRAMAGVGCIQAEVPDWQPINTAPKDGTRVLATHQEDYLFYAEIVEWMDDGWFNGELIEPEDRFTHWMFISPIRGVPR